MSEDTVEHNQEEPRKFDKVKEVAKNHWKGFAVGVVLTVATVVVAKKVGVKLQYSHIEETAKFIDNTVMNDSSSLYKVFNIYANGFKNHGPSWMIKCVETGKLFASQDAAAKAMDLSRAHLSSHLNGMRHSVAGFHFERIGIAA